MVHPEQHVVLADAWDRLMDACGMISSQAQQYTFLLLLTAYSEPHRHYHNLHHIGCMLESLEGINGWLRDPSAVLFATWYHDVVYDPRSNENEVRSAEVARASLRELGLPQLMAARVAELILMTRDHRAPEDDLDAGYFLDADLEVLAWPDRYAEYSAAIRREYAFVPESEYRAGRSDVLRGLLDRRPTIYHTEWNQKRFEASARANILAELARLES